MQWRRRINPKEDAILHVAKERDKEGFEIKYISAFKGRGIFTSVTFEKGDFLLEYRGELISKQECERRLRLYHGSLKVFMFEFKFNGKHWCVDAAKEDGSFGRLVNDDHINPNAKMKFMTVEGKPHLCLFAVRDITPGEEVNYNYGDSDWPWRCKKPEGTFSEGQHGGLPPTSEPSTISHKQSRKGWKKEASAGSSFRHPQSSDRVTTESSQTETTVSKPKLRSDISTNQTTPELLDVCSGGQDVDEYIPGDIPEAMNSPPTAEDFEEGIFINETFVNVDTKSSQSEKPVHKPRLKSDIIVNQTSPAPGELCTGGQRTTENGQDQTTSPTQMSPVLNIIKCQKHCLVCTTVSSLNKCVGPVSSFKWLGYKCKGLVTRTTYRDNGETRQKGCCSAHTKRGGCSVSPDEIMSSDAEAKDRESESEDDSGTASTAPECGTSEPEGATSSSIDTQQIHDTGDYEETVSIVTSTVNETVPPSEGKNADHDNEKRRVPKKPWSKAEVTAVMCHFRDHINKRKLATRNECSHCKLVVGSVLAQRTLQNNFIYFKCDFIYTFALRMLEFFMHKDLAVLFQ